MGVLGCAEGEGECDEGARLGGGEVRFVLGWFGLLMRFLGVFCSACKRRRADSGLELSFLLVLFLSFGVYSWNGVFGVSFVANDCTMGMTAAEQRIPEKVGIKS